MRGYLLVIAVALALTSCWLPPASSTPPPPAAYTPAPAVDSRGVQRVPGDLPVTEGERQFLDSLERAGAKVLLVGASKFDTLLGVRLESRFVRTDLGSVEVLFLHGDRQPISVCAERGGGRFIYRVTHAGQTQVVDAGGEMNFRVADDLFAWTFDLPLDATLQRAFGGSSPGC